MKGAGQHCILVPTLKWHAGQESLRSKAVSLFWPRRQAWFGHAGARRGVRGDGGRPAAAAADAAVRRGAGRAAGPHPLRPPAGRRCACLGTSLLLHHAGLLTVQPPATTCAQALLFHPAWRQPQIRTPGGLAVLVCAHSLHLLLARAGRAAGPHPLRPPAGRRCAYIGTSPARGTLLRTIYDTASRLRERR